MRKVLALLTLRFLPARIASMFLFITSTTYAQWLPGDERGFVSHVNDNIHNKYGEAYDADILWLKKYSLEHLKGEPIFLNHEQAKVLFEQFQETISYWHWKLYGAAVMPNHIHVLLETSDDAEPEKVAGNLKKRGSRRLNDVFGKPASGTWWTSGSSIRRKTADSIPDVIRYIKNQHNALLVWIAPEYDVE
jgi:REP element-mobilizing transposase RayT